MILDEVVGLGLDSPDEGEAGDTTGDEDSLQEIVRSKEARDSEYVARGGVTTREGRIRHIFHGRFEQI